MHNITQQTIDDIIPAANRMIRNHNRRYPAAQLLLFPKGKRIVCVTPFSDGTDEKEDLHHSVAVYYFSDGKIYFDPKKLAEQTEAHATIIDGIYQPTRLVPTMLHLTLLNILLHEDLHRSSKRRILNGMYETIYKDVASHWYRECDRAEEIAFVTSNGCKVVASSLRVLFEPREKEKKLGSNPDLDEFVTHWLDAHLTGEQLAEAGCFRTAEEATWALLASKNFMNTAQFDRALEQMERTQQSYASIAERYLASDIPLIVARETMTRKPAVYRARALFATAMGWVGFLPQIMRTVVKRQYS